MVPMRPEDLYEVVAEDVELDAPVLVHALGGFLDAGAARQLAVAHLLATHDHRTVAEFDVDVLYDYRARRPRMVFDTDHYVSIDMPELLLSEVTDSKGTGFLLLHGPEPDLGWRTFTSSVVELVERYGVRRSIGWNAIPWPSPHTRPVGVTAHSTDPSLVTGRPTFVGAIEVPGHLAGGLEIALGEAGHEAMGFAVHIPHYLAQVQYPRAAVALLRETAVAGGLALDFSGLEIAADIADRDIDQQVQANPDNLEAVRALEAQYDAVERGAATALPLAGDEPLPTADEIGAAVEDFLRELDDQGKPEDRT
jgi:hypothetical protein